MAVVFDTYAWIEFFKGTEKGRRVKALLSEENVLTSALSLAELAAWSLREGAAEDKADAIAKLVCDNSAIVNVDPEVARLSAKINFEAKKSVKGWGLADSVVYATALLFSARVLTGDKHFFGKEFVELL